MVRILYTRRKQTVRFLLRIESQDKNFKMREKDGGLRLRQCVGRHLSEKEKMSGKPKLEVNKRQLWNTGMEEKKNCRERETIKVDRKSCDGTWSSSVVP